MANEISTVLLDYRKLHNSCTPLLIFGAGARITAGLTNINAKHLALTSQSLSFIALIPYVRKCVRRRPSITASGMAEYDRLKRLFQDHRSSIHEKFIDIMSFRVTLYIREMEKIKWDDEMKNRCRGTLVHAWRRSRKSRTRYNEF
ncbi:GARP complex component [Histoplasma capsulatum G186AR]|nr:GARP complex component [Histoplasma capsulatum]QSS70555.1 GARP complex component [Histoplasma capsulatum G186AR]